MLFNKTGTRLKQFFRTGWQFTVINWIYIIKSKDFAFTKHINKRSSCRTACITYYTWKLDVAVFKNTHHTVLLWSYLLNKLVPVTRQVTKLTLLLGRNIARFEKTCQKKLADPFAVHLVCLVTRNILNVTGIDYPDIGNGIFKNLINRLPVNTGTLHSHMRYTIGQ